MKITLSGRGPVGHLMLGSGGSRTDKAEQSRLSGSHLKLWDYGESVRKQRQVRHNLSPSDGLTSKARGPRCTAVKHGELLPWTANICFQAAPRKRFFLSYFPSPFKVHLRSFSLYTTGSPWCGMLSLPPWQPCGPHSVSLPEFGVDSPVLGPGIPIYARNHRRTVISSSSWRPCLRCWPLRRC